MSADQLAFDLPEFAPPPPVDHRPACSACGAPSLANVYGFQWYEPRRAFVGGPRSTACREHLEEVTAAVRAKAVTAGVAVELVWSHIHQPGDFTFEKRLPGTEFAWHVVEVIQP